MCLAIPARVLSVEGLHARVDMGGVERLVHIPLLPDVKVGEHVLVHAGFAIQRIDESEASITLAMFEEVVA